MYCSVFKVNRRKICLASFMSFVFRRTNMVSATVLEQQELNTELPPASEPSPLSNITYKQEWLKASQMCRCRISLARKHSE